MRKMAIFNVGGAMSAYLRIDNHDFVVDLGSSDEFSPTKDFLVPLFSARRAECLDGKYGIDQLIISHPHWDHISDIKAFDQHFNPYLLTCHNDKSGQENELKLNFEKFKANEGDDDIDEIKELKRAYLNRDLPLMPFDEKILRLFYLDPGTVEHSQALSSESYCNNVSIVAVFTVGQFTIVLPGDIMKEGTKSLLGGAGIYSSSGLAKILERDGVSVLVAPHHGLESSFSDLFFKKIRGGKVRNLIIVPEKVSTDERRKVDSRYYSSDYCRGLNNLQSTNGQSGNYGRKTSQGHIVIDLESDPDNLKVKIIEDNDDLVREFLI